MTDSPEFEPDLDVPIIETTENESEVEAPQYRKEADETPATTAAGEQAEGEPKTPLYPNVHAWVNGWLLPSYRRQLTSTKRKWDPNWWRYEEVGGALEALWQAWEHLRLQPGTGIAVFYRDYLYPIMDQLTSPDGPFWNYHDSYPTVKSNTIPKPWETTNPPGPMYRQDGDPREQ